MKCSKIFFTLGLGLLFCSQARADIPKLINFQGILKDTLGSPLANDTVQVVFTIYDDPSAGNVKWSETDTVITDADGLFNILLGRKTLVPDTAFAGTARWLGIKVGADAELTSRNQLVSAAYGYRINTVDGANGGTISGNLTVTDTVFTNFLSSSSPLRLQTSGTTRLYIDDVTGNVGIGTTAPETRLDVYNQGSSVSDVAAILGLAENSSSGQAYGGFFNVLSAGSGTHYGLRSTVAGSGNTYGLFTSNSGTGTLNYGVSASVSGAGIQNRGVAGIASGASGFNYGIYGSATGASSYAGKFENAKVGIGNAGTQDIVDADGDLYVEDELEVDGAARIDGSTFVVHDTANQVSMGTDTTGSFGSLLYLNKNENTTSTRIALDIRTKNTSSGSLYGMFIESGDDLALGTGPRYGLYGVAQGSSDFCIGVRGEAGGTGANYGINGVAPSGAGNYAGYFSGNKVRMTTNAGNTTTNGIGDRWRDNGIVAWGKVLSTGAIQGTAEFGVSSVSRDSTGAYTITLDATAGAAEFLIPMAQAEVESPGTIRIVSINQNGTNTFSVYINNSAFARVDSDFVFMVTAR